MTKRESKLQPAWTDVKAQLATFDRTALLDLLRQLYAAHKDNQAFLHARGVRFDWIERTNIGSTRPTCYMCFRGPFG